MIALELPIMNTSEASYKHPSRRGTYGKELRKLYDICKQHIRAIELSEHSNLDMFLTIAMELKMDEVTRFKWKEYSNDSQITTPYSELLKFLDIQAQHFKSVTSKRKPLTTTHRF